MKNVKSICIAGQVLLLLMPIPVVFSPIYAWWGNFFPSLSWVEITLSGPDYWPLSLGQKMAGSLINLGSIVLLLCLIVSFFRFFTHCRRTYFFDLNALIQLRKAVHWMLWYTIYLPFQNTMLTLVATWNLPVGKRKLTIALCSDDFSRFFACLLLALGMQILVEGIRLKRENDLTV